MIKKQRNEDDTTESHVNQLVKHNNVPQIANVVIDPSLINEIERSGGFPATYTTNSLNSDELNYATAFYYLLCIAKEYWEELLWRTL